MLLLVIQYITLVCMYIYQCLVLNGYRLTVDHSSSKRYVPIRIRLAVRIDIGIIRAINLIGKELPCRGSRCRIVADIARI